MAWVLGYCLSLTVLVLIGYLADSEHKIINWLFDGPARAILIPTAILCAYVIIFGQHGLMGDMQGFNIHQHN
jgi:hypothetical protein